MPVSGLTATTGTTLSYSFVVPTGATSLTFQISGGSGDADLYVKYGSPPTTSSYDCRPYVNGNNETCNMSPTAGTWYVMVRAYSSFANVSLVATYTTGGGGGNQLQNGVPVSGLAATTGVQLSYTLAVPAGASNLSFQISGGSGDADLYVKFGAPPTTSSYDCRPYINGNNETCAMPSATAGTWYVMVRAYSSFSNVSLVASYTTGSSSNTPPTANAGPDQTVTAGAAVSLPGSGTDPDGTIASYAWTQTAPASPAVTLGNANSATASFTAPTVSVATVFTFKLTVTDNQGATGFDTVNVTVNPAGGGGGNQLQNGVPVSGLTATTGATVNYSFVVPTGATSLTFQISGGSGDADLYVKYGSPPTTSSYDCRPYVSGNNETCAMPSATAGTWYVMVRAYSSFTNVSLMATYTTGGGSGTTALQPGIPTPDLSGATGVTLSYSFEVPSGVSSLIFQMTGTTGDADLYVKYGSAPTTSSYDCRPYVSGNNETCAMPSATAGTWYVMVRGYTSFAGVKLLASYATTNGIIVIPPSVPSANICVATPRENPFSGMLPCPSGTGGQCSNFSINQNGTKGTATITNSVTGQFTYTPTGTTWGVDTFSYTALDGTGNSYPATAAVIIKPRVMPLGDSITAGITNDDTPAAAIRVGYRKPLYDSLSSAGYFFDFVGSQNDGYSVADFDPDNEAHPGWTSSEILFGTTYAPYQDPNCPTCNLIDWLNAEKPDIVLLHIGTNGFTTNPANVSAILNSINLWSTSANGNPVAVFLAQIINRNPYQSVDVLGYNQNLAMMVQNRQAWGAGPRTFLVDQESALAYPTDLLSDPIGLHPDANGYAKMAGRWFSGLTSSGLMLKCP